MAATQLPRTTPPPKAATTPEFPAYLDLSWRGKALLYVILSLGALVMVLPFIWMASTACKPPPELSQVPIRLLPQEPVCGSNLDGLYLRQPEFNRMMFNTALVTVARVIGQIVFCSLAAYGFARFRFPGREVLFAATLGLLMVPYQAIVIPQFILINGLDLKDTFVGLISPNLFNAFGLFLLRQAFLQIPRELEESAEIDGANPLQILWLLVIPLSIPALAAFAVIAVQAAWNDFLWPLVITTSSDTRVVTVAIALLQGERSTPWNLIMMGSLIATLPMILLFMTLQRYFIEGVALSGVKR